MKKQTGTAELLLCLGEILVGILLLVNPVGFTSGIITAGGIVLAAVGFYNIIWYFKTPAEEAARGSRLAMGLGVMAVGLFCVFGTRKITAAFSLLTMLYGIAVLAAGLGKVQVTMDLLRCKKPRWYLAAAAAAVTLICGAVVLLNPFNATQVLWQFIGISLLAEAVLDLVSIIACGRLRSDAPPAKKEP